jgi:hypothetical protein
MIEEGEVRMAMILPGCVAVGAVGETREEVLRLIREAIEFHIDGLKRDGLPIPAPTWRASSSKWRPRNFGMQPTAFGRG